MQKLILYPHGGSENHGCEALVRSTIKILGSDSYEVLLASKSPEQDIKYEIDKYCSIIRQNTLTISLFDRIIAGIKYRIFGDKLAYERLTYKDVMKRVDENTICLSFGGDNYCYGKPTYIYIMNKLFRSLGARTILWGCSIEPDNIDARMIADLKGYYRIVARESLTYNALLSVGLNNVTLCPDPAFTLDSDESAFLPKEFVIGNTVGINLSPMAISYSGHNEVILRNYQNLIAYILEKTNMNVALIPHVVWEDNDDRKPLKILYEKFKSSSRICMIEDGNCEKLKGVIARCRYLITARTHASIAAYSTGIPTIVMGYSIKAKGIATDLFGTDKGYVLPVQDLKSDNDLCDAFRFLEDNEYKIKEILISSRKRLLNGALEMKQYLC